MPHITVKLFEGRDKDTKMKLAKALQAETGKGIGLWDRACDRCRGGIRTWRSGEMYMTMIFREIPIFFCRRPMTGTQNI